MKWNHEQHSKKQFRLGFGDPFFHVGEMTNNRIVSNVLLFFSEDRKGANNLWMIVSQSLTFSTQFIITFHTTRLCINMYTLLTRTQSYIILLLKTNLYIHVSLHVQSFFSIISVICKYEFPVPDIAYLLLLFLCDFLCEKKDFFWFVDPP